MPVKLGQLRPNQVMIPIAILLFMIVVGNWAYTQWQAKTQSLAETLELRETQMDKYARIAQNSKNYEAINRSLQNLQAEIQDQRLFYAGTEALAQARFQNLIKEFARKHRIDIRSTNVDPARRQDNFSLLRLRIDAKAEIADISNFLLDLREEGHYIFVSDLEIRTINRNENRYYYLTAGLVAIRDI